MCDPVSVISIKKIGNVNDKVVIKILHRACRRILEDRTPLSDLLTQGMLVNWLTQETHSEEDVLTILDHVTAEIKKPAVSNFISTLYNLASKSNTNAFVEVVSNKGDITLMTYKDSRQPLSREELSGLVYKYAEYLESGSVMGKAQEDIVSRLVSLCSYYGDVDVAVVERAFDIKEFDPEVLSLKDSVVFAIETQSGCRYFKTK